MLELKDEELEHIEGSLLKAISKIAVMLENNTLVKDNGSLKMFSEPAESGLKPDELRRTSGRTSLRTAMNSQFTLTSLSFPDLIVSFEKEINLLEGRLNSMGVLLTSKNMKDDGHSSQMSVVTSKM